MHIFHKLDAHESIPDQKYNYVLCRFYNKNHNFSLYVRQDLKLYKHQILQFEFNNIRGYVSTAEIQSHPVSGKVIHRDFVIIEQGSRNIRMRLPLKFENQEKCQAIKLGGFLYITSRSIDVKFDDSSKVIPYLPVDVSPFASEQSIGVHHMHFPDGIKSIRDKLTVATVMPSKGAES